MIGPRGDDSWATFSAIRPTAREGESPVLRRSGSSSTAVIRGCSQSGYRPLGCIGAQRLQGRKPAASASPLRGKNSTFSRFGGRAGQPGRQKMPVILTPGGLDADAENTLERSVAINKGTIHGIDIGKGRGGIHDHTLTELANRARPIFRHQTTVVFADANRPGRPPGGRDESVLISAIRGWKSVNDAVEIASPTLTAIFSFSPTSPPAIRCRE